MLDCMDNFLELLELVEFDLPLDVSILISINTVIKGVLKLFWEFVVKESNMFSKSLLSAIIQDSSIKGKSDELLYL